jgi:hypothetical protein
LDARDYVELVIHAPDNGTQWLGAHAGYLNRFLQNKVSHSWRRVSHRRDGHRHLTENVRSLQCCCAPPHNNTQGCDATLAGDLSTLSQDADRITTIKSLPIPLRSCSIGRDSCLFIFEGPSVSTDRASDGRAQVATVGAHEAKPAGAEGEDLELPGVMGDVMSLTEQQEVVEVGTAAVDPVNAMVGLQTLRIRATRMSAMTVLTHE